MSLLVMEGFDLGDVAIRGDFLGTGVSTNTNIATAFSYGKYAALGSDGMYFAKSITVSNHVFTGCRLYLPTNYALSLSIRGDAGATEHIYFHLTGIDGSGYVQTGGTTRNTWSAGTFPLNSWFYLEAEAVISDTVGLFSARLNGSTTSLFTYNGDTKNGGTNSSIDQVRWIQNGNNNNTYYDDWYVCNDQGSTNNGFLGDVRVYTLSPNGNGTNSQLVGSDADSVNNYLLVDEQPYATADYVGSPTVGNMDTYATTDLAAGTILGVQPIYVAQKSDAGTGQIRSVIKSSSTYAYGTTQVLSTGWVGYADAPREVDPNTSAAWGLSAVNALEVGVQVQ